MDVSHRVPSSYLYLVLGKKSLSYKVNVSLVTASNIFHRKIK